MSKSLIQSLDHFVLTVADPQATIAFYRDVLGMEPVQFGEGRHALAFGSQKINLHVAGAEFVPHAGRPVPGSADFCLLTDEPVEALATRFEAAGVAVFLGPVDKTGATGPLRSIYIKDPDGNLVEIKAYRRIATVASSPLIPAAAETPNDAGSAEST